MDILYRLFRSSIRWNTAGALAYQVLLITYQTILFKTMAPETYGFLSIILSMVYLGALVADGGLDATLSTFFGRLICQKSFFLNYMLPHWLSTGALAMAVSIVGIGVAQSMGFTHALSPLIIISSTLMILSEGLRRSLRMTLQLAFRAKHVSSVDVSMLIGYLLCILIFSLFGVPLTLELVISLLALFSFASALVLAIIVYHWIKKLPSDRSFQETFTVTHRTITVHRFTNCGNLLTHQLFSGNVLVPLVALSSGLSNAGMIKLASYLAHGLVTVMRKIFGCSGTALLSALKSTSTPEKNGAFWLLSRNLYATLLFSAIAMTSMSYHLYVRQAITHQVAVTLCLLVSLIISEGLYLVYEALYIIEEKPLHLLVLNGAATLSISTLLVFATNTMSISHLLGTILGIRLFLFSLMAFGAVQFFALSLPRPTINRRLLTKVTALISLAYVCGTPLALLLVR